MELNLKIDDLSECRVAIIGMGLMGGSMAMALRGSCQEIFGVDRDAYTLGQALDREVITRATTQPEELLPDTDLIILATPVSGILDILERLPKLMQKAAMIVDLGSTKAEIVQKMSTLPDRFDPLGGHPICGKENIGFTNADPKIYQEALFALTPLSRSSTLVRRIASQLVQAVGANPIWVEAERHDDWVARTSHIPFLAANALATIVPEDAASLVGPGLRSTTRLAPTPWSMMGDILATNRKQVLAGLKEFRRQVQAIERLLEREDFVSLEECLAQGADNYEKVIHWIDRGSNND